MQPASCWCRLFAPVDIASVVFFRVVFGAVMIWWLCDKIANGTVDRHYVAPAFHFNYFGFGWVRPWPGIGMYLHFYALVACAAGLLLGLAYRIAATFFFLGFTYVFLLDETFYNNHYYLISLIGFALIFVPANRALSVDVLIRPKLQSTTISAWNLWLLRALVGLPYFYGGVSKLGSDWLHGEPIRTLLSRENFAVTLGPDLRGESTIMLLSYGGLLFDLVVVPLLLWKPTRIVAFVAAVAFHLSNVMVFNRESTEFNIGIFPWLMIGATTIFFSPSWQRSVFLRTSPGNLPPTESAAPVRLSGRQKVTLFLLGAFLTVQFVIPFRHLLYAGDANWTDEGHKFAWRMILRDKTVMSAGIYVRYRDDGRTVIVDPAQHLLPQQHRVMMGTPDCLLQYCHYLDRVLREGGHEDFEVHADITVSLNGREPQRLIDPNVDLAAQPRSFKSASWIMPLTEPLSARDQTR